MGRVELLSVCFRFDSNRRPTAPLPFHGELAWCPLTLTVSSRKTSPMEPGVWRKTMGSRVGCLKHMGMQKN